MLSMMRKSPAGPPAAPAVDLQHRGRPAKSDLRRSHRPGGAHLRADRDDGAYTVCEEQDFLVSVAGRRTVAAQGQAGRRPGPARDGGGWFHPGDLGCATRTATAPLLDRAKDIVISGGENISTIEVENALCPIPTSP